VNVRLTTKEVQYLSLFGSVTGAFAKDCIVGRRTIIFVVGDGEMGKAIGKKGANVKRLEETLGKKVELVEYSSDPAQFIKNIFAPANVTKVNVVERNGKKLAYVILDSKDRRALGRKLDAKVRLAKTLASRHFGIDNVVVA
jgi:N utilization substance protein A